MPLNWDATDCDPVVLADEASRYRTSHFCFVLMAIGASGVKEDNFIELYLRANLWEKLEGEFFDGRPLTLEDFRLRIGYRTNNRHITQKQFLSKLERVWFAEAKERLLSRAL
jgi:hypothetical protein